MAVPPEETTPIPDAEPGLGETVPERPRAPTLVHRRPVLASGLATKASRRMVSKSAAAWEGGDGFPGGGEVVGRYHDDETLELF